MLIFTTLVLIILLSVGYILVSPISIYFGFNFGDGFSGFAGVKLFPFEYKFSRDTTRKTVKTKEVKTKHKKSRVEKGRNVLNSAVELFGVAADELEVLQEITISLLKLLRGILRSPDQHYLKISMAGGLGPPDLTGQLYGAIISVQPVLGNSIYLTYRPDYLAAEMKGEVVAGATLRAHRLLRELLIFAWHLPKIGTVRLFRQLKKGG